jgi:hypothetical protein
VVGQSAGNAVVDAPGIEISLKLYVEGVVLILSRVQLLQLARRQRTNRTFDL